MNRQAFVALVVLVALPCSALADDGVYRFDLAPSGATGMKWRPAGGSTWETAPIVGGYAIIDEQQEGIEIDLQGVAYGMSSMDLSGHPLDTGNVDISFGGLTTTAGGLGRQIDISSFAGTSSAMQGFQQGLGAVFGPELVAAAVIEAKERFGVWVRAAVGVFFCYLLIRKGLRWADIAFGGKIEPKAEWSKHRAEADSLMERNRMERELETRLDEDAKWGGWNREKDLALGD